MLRGKGKPLSPRPFPSAQPRALPAPRRGEQPCRNISIDSRHDVVPTVLPPEFSAPLLFQPGRSRTIIDPEKLLGAIFVESARSPRSQASFEIGLNSEHVARGDKRATTLNSASVAASPADASQLEAREETSAIMKYQKYVAARVSPGNSIRCSRLRDRWTVFGFEGISFPVKV